MGSLSSKFITTAGPAGSSIPAADTAGLSVGVIVGIAMGSAVFAVGAVVFGYKVHRHRIDRRHETSKGSKSVEMNAKRPKNDRGVC